MRVAEKAVVHGGDERARDEHHDSDVVEAVPADCHVLRMAEHRVEQAREAWRERHGGVSIGFGWESETRPFQEASGTTPRLPSMASLRLPLGNSRFRREGRTEAHGRRE